jgi:hypothetical protein
VPDAIRGYGHVKRTSIEAARTREAALRARFAAPAPVSAREEESAVA